MKLSLVGAAGKMGKALTSEVQQNKEFEITNYVVKPNSSLLGKDVGSIHFNQQSNSVFVDDPKNAFDMFVDFADAQNISSRIQMYKKHCKPLIFCSTGLSNDEEKSIIALSEKMPVFIAPNTSVVTALMKDFAKKISKGLDIFAVVNTKIFLSILFIFVISIYGVLFKLLKIDLLRLKKQKNSYWLEMDDDSNNKIWKQY